MKLGRWITAIAALVAIGMLQVAERNTVYLKGYALGERVEKTHEVQTEVAWLETRVLRLTSPEHLSDAAEDRHLNLVAWSFLPSGQSRRTSIAADSIPVKEAPEAVKLADGRDTTD